MPSNIAYIALGSNLDDPIKQILLAINEISNMPMTILLARSSLYQSKPYGLTNQPDFINAVIRVETYLEPLLLLWHLQAIEFLHHRKRTIKNGPRTLDLDILLYDDLQINLPDLIVPHPGMPVRSFVIKPLNELADSKAVITDEPIVI